MSKIKIAIVGLIMAVFAAIISLSISRRISRPIETMTQGAERFAQGDLKHRLKQAETVELARLAKARGAERDRELNRKKNEEAKGKAITAQIRQLVEMNHLPLEGEVEIEATHLEVLLPFKNLPRFEQQIKPGQHRRHGPASTAVPILRNLRRSCT